MKPTPAGGVRDPATNAPPRVVTGGTTLRVPVKPKLPKTV